MKRKHINMKHDNHKDEHFLPEGEEDFGREINGCEGMPIPESSISELPMGEILDALLEGFEEEQMIWFLEDIGYRVVPRIDHITKEEYLVAVLPDSPVIPEDEDLVDTFIREVKLHLLRVLRKYGKEENRKSRGNKSKGSRKVGGSDTSN